MEILEISPFNKEVQELFRLLDAHNTSLCPPEICHLTQAEELNALDSILLGGFLDKELCAMGALKYFRDYAEVTRMFVKNEHRGKGFGHAILVQLEQKAKQRSLTYLKLETSDKFKAACSLYINFGFEPCEPFGEYIEKPYNTYLCKQIG